MTAEQTRGIALLDVDGTLVDSTYLHALAWHRAFGDHDVMVAFWRVHRAIGMGGDKLVAHVAGDEVEDRLGEELREGWEEHFEPLRDQVTALRGASDLVRALAAAGIAPVLASSGKSKYLDDAIDLLGIRDQVTAVTTSDDTEDSKPDPDILAIALDRAAGELDQQDLPAFVVGDSVYDIQAAQRLGLACIGVRTGGFGVAELTEAGAVLVVDEPVDLLETDLTRYWQDPRH